MVHRSSVICLLISVGLSLSAMLLPRIASGEDVPSMAATHDPLALARMMDDASPPSADDCDDYTILRRLTLDRFGRVPSVSEVRDFVDQVQVGDRKHTLEQFVRTIVYQPDQYVPGGDIDAANRLADFWTAELTPASTESGPTTIPLRTWLFEQFRQSRPLDELAAMLVDPASAGGAALVDASGGTTASYTAAISRGLLGVRLECAQCHDHPFASWKMKDFWGLAAHFGNDPRSGSYGRATYEGQTFFAKPLDAPERHRGDGGTPDDLAKWITDRENPYFAANLVNRTYQQLVGKPLVSPVLDLDQADPKSMQPLRAMGRQLADAGYSGEHLTSAVFLSSAYASRSTDDSLLQSARTVKVLSPRQVFASLEQALLLPVGRIDQESARHNGIGRLVTERLSRATDADPREYVAGVPQALLMMNGPMTTSATSDRGRLLAAVVDAPFFDSADDRIDVLFLATLTRHPTAQERGALADHRENFDGSEKEFLSDVLWSLINSPEVMLCR